jgi:hypothetical protein
MNGIMTPIRDPQETIDLQGITARGSTTFALWGQLCARLPCLSTRERYCPKGGRSLRPDHGGGYRDRRRVPRDRRVHERHSGPFLSRKKRLICREELAMFP